MSWDTPGGDTVVLLKRPERTTRRLPTDPPVTGDQRLTKTGCHVEIQRPVENLDLATVNAEIAWVFLPVDDDAAGMLPKDAIEYNSRVYEMQGPAVVERVDGEAVQVWCTAKWEQG